MATTEYSVVLIDSVEDSLRTLRQTVMDTDGLQVTGEAENGRTGYELIHQLRPHIVILDVMPGTETFDMIERIRNFLTNAYIIVTAPTLDGQLVLQAMRVGARDVLVRPVNRDELQTALTKAASALSQHQREEETQEGQVVSVFSSKGGLGTTAIASNLAIALARQGFKTVLVDTNLRGGDTSLVLDLQPTHTIFDVSQNIARADTVFLRGCLTEHKSGLLVLAEPYEPDAADLVAPAQVQQIVRLLKTMHDFVIVDNSPTLDELTMSVLDVSDTVLLLLILSLPSIRSTQRALDIFTRLRYEEGKVRLVINRFDSQGDIQITELEETLRHPVWWHVPNDFFAVSKSINQGVAALDLSPDSRFSHNMIELAAQLAPSAQGAPLGVGNLEPEKKGLLGLFRR